MPPLLRLHKNSILFIDDVKGVLMHYDLLIIAGQCGLSAKFVAIYLTVACICSFPNIMQKTYHENYYSKYILKGSIIFL